MFQNSYQNGTFFDVLDLKNTPDKLKTVYKTTNVIGNNKVFDKELKTFVLEFNSANSKMQLPKDQKKDLYLIQQYLVLQLYFFPGAPWIIELSLSDLTKTKRRVILSHNSHKLEIKPFFVKAPCHDCTEGAWNNMVIDLYSYMEAFKGQTYRSLDSIALTGQFKLRRIFTSASEPIDCSMDSQSHESKQINFLPKNYYYPPGVAHTAHLIHFTTDYPEDNGSEVTEHTIKQIPTKTKAKGVHGTRLQKNESVKTEKQIREHEVRYASSKKKKDFLANTNGTQVMARNRKKEKGSESQLSEGNPSSNFSNHVPSKSIDHTKKKKQLTKTQEIPPKPRSNLDSYNVAPKKGKEAPRSKINPWRNNKLTAGYTDTSQLQASKDERNTETAQTTSMLKTKNVHSRFTDTKNLGFDKRSDNYSQNEYVELSQKFSTLTDGKFFKNEVNPNQDDKKNEEDQIEENIEMETASVHSRGKEDAPGVVERQAIKQSISDSLDGLGKEKIQQKIEGAARSSLYGFGEQLMLKFMTDIERPYSPPLGEKQQTQQSLTEHPDPREEVQLIFDPVLNCYYDHKTHTYYQLKN